MLGEFSVFGETKYFYSNIGRVNKSFIIQRTSSIPSISVTILIQPSVSGSISRTSQERNQINTVMESVKDNLAQLNTGALHLLGEHSGEMLLSVN